MNAACRGRPFQQAASCACLQPVDGVLASCGALPFGRSCLQACILLRSCAPAIRLARLSALAAADFASRRGVATAQSPSHVRLSRHRIGCRGALTCAPASRCVNTTSDVLRLSHSEQRLRSTSASMPAFHSFPPLPRPPFTMLYDLPHTVLGAGNGLFDAFLLACATPCCPSPKLGLW